MASQLGQRVPEDSSFSVPFSRFRMDFRGILRTGLELGGGRLRLRWRRRWIAPPRPRPVPRRGWAT